jgi:pimeloyl-ACP methyl ester carboxylesterase
MCVLRSTRIRALFAVRRCSVTMEQSLTIPTGELELLDIPGNKDQTALVLLHEGLGSIGLWRGFPQALAQATGQRTVAYSRYGHGQSDPPTKPRTPNFMHEEALEVLPGILDHLELEQPMLIGHSDGASIALIHAAHHEVRSVVAIAPHVFVEQMCITEIRHARDAYEHGGLRERMARYHRDPDTAFYGWNDVWLDPRFPEWDIRPLLERISCPLLLIQGERDQYGTLAQLEAIEQATMGPVERVVLDCMHAPPVEARTETLASITSFLDRLGGDELSRPRPGDSARPPAARTRR